MSTHKIHGESLSFYFITFTCYKWLPLFDKADVYEYFPFWFSKLEEKGFVFLSSESPVRDSEVEV